MNIGLQNQKLFIATHKGICLGDWCNVRIKYDKVQTDKNIQAIMNNKQISILNMYVYVL